MNHEKKIEKVLETALTYDLTEYYTLLKALRKKLPFLVGTRRIAAALLKEFVGDISKLDVSFDWLMDKSTSGKVVFEDVKDGKARLFINIGKNHNISHI